MSTALFLRLLPYDNKATVLTEAVTAVREGRSLNPVVHTVDPASFRQVPGSPFAYWVSDRIRRLFTELPPFESDGRTVRVGLQTSDDFRFVRAWWEVKPESIVSGQWSVAESLERQTTDNGQLTADDFRRQTFEGKRWVPFAKGGEYSPYYADLHLVVNWERDGEEMKAWADPLYDNSGWSRIIKSVNFYFRPGLTWPLREIRLSAQAVPGGAIFSIAGKLATSERMEELLIILALMNSTAFDFLVGLFAGKVGGVQYEVGLIGRIPLPKNFSTSIIRDKALKTCKASALQTSYDERSHLFFLPTFLQMPGKTLSARLAVWQARLTEAKQQLAECRREIDTIVFRLYGIEDEDRRAIEEVVDGQSSVVRGQLSVVRGQSSVGDEEAEEAETESPANDPEQQTTDNGLLTTDLLSYAVGCIFGRWDIRFATGELPAPELSDPFAPLPAYSPGMLTPERATDDGQRTTDRSPLTTDKDGLLVDDPDHPDDIIRRVREVLEIIWGERAEAIEREACEILGVKELRDYFRKPGNGGFWMDHVRRYSKSRRKAPIYWLLQSSKKNYALWLYYHRLDKDILFKALVNYVEPKLRLEESRLEAVRGQLSVVRGGAAGATDDGPRTKDKKPKTLEKQLDRQEALLSELHDFHDKLRRAADLHLEPDLNDGVVLNIAPLWELVPWNEAKAYWEELLAGKYEWSSIGKQLRQKGLVGKG